MGLFWWMSFDPVSYESERSNSVPFPTETHSTIRHITDPVYAHAQAQNRPRPLAFSSPEPVVSWSRGLRFKLSRVALGTRMVPWVLEREPWERGCLGMANTKSKKSDDYL